MVEDYSLPCLDMPRRCRVDLALHSAQRRPRLAEVHPLDDLQVGHRQERAGPKRGVHTDE
jgi:hypothetical protein